MVANRVKRNTVVFRSLMKFLESLEIPVAAVLRDTQNYIKSAAGGRGLGELDRADVEKDMIQWKRMVGWLEACDPRPQPESLRVPSSPAPLARPYRLVQ